MFKVTHLISIGYFSFSGHKNATWEEVVDSLNYTSGYHVQFSSFDNLHLPCSIHGKFIFPLLPYPFQLLYIHVMQLVHVRLIWLTCLVYLDGPAHHNVKWSSIRENARVVIEYPPGVEQGNGKTQYFLDDELCLVDERVLFRLHLIIQLVFWAEIRSQRCQKISSWGLETMRNILNSNAGEQKEGCVPPKARTGTKSAPVRIASFTKPLRRLSTRRRDCGCASNDSRAPPTTIVMPLPIPSPLVPPRESRFSQDSRDTEARPSDRAYSRYLD